MAVTSVKEIRKSRSSVNTIKNETTYTRVFQVECNSKNDGPQIARLAVPISLGDVYSTAGESDSLAFCIRKSAEAYSEDGQSYHVTCEYGKREKTELSPLDEPADITVSSNSGTKTVYRDIQGTIIANSAGQPYSADGSEIDDSRFAITIIKNHASFNFTLAVAYKDAVNAGTFGTSYGIAIPPRCAKLSQVTASRKRDQTYGFYWTVQYNFAIDLNTFDKIFLDQGLEEKTIVDDVVVYRPILHGSVPVNSPVPLNGAGAAKSPNANPVYRSHRCYNSLSFQIFEGL